ncbi:MAG: tRNA (adenosine(37)-N6)-dimethylallyltransferase MiaA [Salibacteraceae bacterium]
MKPKPHLVVVAGPTAVGKTSVSIEIAKHFNTEIVNADSRQFYKEISIGTAVPSAEELAQVEHHLIQSHSVTTPINSGDYEEIGIELLDQLFKRQNIVVLTGGSGMFIDALANGIDTDLPKPDLKKRKELENLNLTELQKKLLKLDPVYYNQVDLKNPHRLIRAIEVCLITGKPYSALRKDKPKTRPFEILKICLHEERATLYDRINKRVDLMIESGLEKEARSVEKFKDLKSLNTVGYSEWFLHFDGEISKEETIEIIKRNSRRYAKRQLTWFKRDPQYHWFKKNQVKEILELIHSKQSN